VEPPEIENSQQDTDFLVVLAAKLNVMAEPEVRLEVAFVYQMSTHSPSSREAFCRLHHSIAFVHVLLAASVILVISDASPSVVPVDSSSFEMKHTPTFPESRVAVTLGAYEVTAVPLDIASSEPTLVNDPPVGQPVQALTSTDRHEPLHVRLPPVHP
jgi:hypothetical protein